MLGQRASAHFQHHRGTLAWSVVVLLHAINHALSGREIHHALAADRVSNCTALGRVLAFGLNRDRVVTKDVKMAFGIGLLKEFTALGRGSDGVENSRVGDARLGVIRDELVSVCRNSNAWITSSSGHKSLSVYQKILLSQFCRHKRLDQPKSIPEEATLSLGRRRFRWTYLSAFNSGMS